MNRAVFKSQSSIIGETMANPVLVEVTRGQRVESRHRGAVVISDAQGSSVLSIGDIEQLVFPRSAVKSIQALPLVESGAADAFGFTAKELAMACASHSGEPEHAQRAQHMLGKAGLTQDVLECGAHWPTRQETALDLARTGEKPSALHNNCSGKHAGFVCTCAHLGIDTRGYVNADHQMQKMICEAMESVTGAAHTVDVCGTDGCSIPTYAVPLKNLARGFARMVTGEGLAPVRAKSARRLLDACMEEPFYVAGTDRLDTKLMNAASGRVMVKMGAEGVFCGAIPELGLGIALKCDDGGLRAAEIMVTAALLRVFRKNEEFSAVLHEFSNPVMKNWNGIEVGTLRPAGDLA